MIALVKRPRRKMHLASRQGSGAWVTVCDRDVEHDGAEVVPLEQAVGVVDGRAAEVCAHCHRLILMADVVHRMGAGRLLASLELTA